MAKIKIPYLIFKRSVWRWEPGPKLRLLGFVSRNLVDEYGNKLSEGDAIMAARALNAEATAKRLSTRPEPIGLPRPVRTIEELWQRYIASSKFTRLAASTRTDYINKSKFFREGFTAAHSFTRENGRVVLAGDVIGNFADTPVAALSGPHMHGYSEDLLELKGKHMTLGIMAVFRRVLKYAEIIGWREKGSNPANALELPRPAPRLRLITAQEVEALVAAADLLGVPSCGDAIVLALHSGQRQKDVLNIPDRIIDAGRIKLKQFKRGAAVDVKMTPFCSARMEQARSRKAELAIVPLDPIIILERTGLPYQRSSQFNKEWLKVRRAAEVGIIDEAATEDALAAHRAKGRNTPPPITWRVQPCESLSDVKFLDLRDTAVTRLAMAGCNKWEIASITGHAYGSIEAILKHYLVLNDGFADAGIDKLVTWMEKEGIEI